MKPAHTQNESFWSKTARISPRSPLTDDATADVCIVGAGIAGLSTAYLLGKAGLKVIVLDDGKIGAGQTACTSAHLSYMLDRRYQDLVGSRGEPIAKLAAQSHAAAIDLIESIALEESIECDFARIDGYLFAPDNDPGRIIEQELAVLQRLGMPVEPIGQVPWSECQTGPALRVPRQARFHPLKYLRALSADLKRFGGVIHCKSHVTEIVGGKDAHVKTTSGATVSCQHIVVATNTPVNDLLAIHTKQAPYMTYVVGARIPGDKIPDALYWDTEDPYHYIRLQPGDAEEPRSLLIIGGEDHKTGQANDGEERYGRLEAWGRSHFPAMQEVEYHWSGQVMESLDGLAFIGHNPDDQANVYIATGDSGLGLTHGTIAGRLLTDLIQGQPNEWSAVYDPARTPVGAIGAFVKENLNVAAQFAQWLLPGDVQSADEIKPGEGAIIREGLNKIAVYRDPRGTLTKLSAICPHLKCVVQWNSSETTWDCPCHGSRFDAHGKVLIGPANCNLSEHSEPAAAK